MSFHKCTQQFPLCVCHPFAFSTGTHLQSVLCKQVRVIKSFRASTQTANNDDVFSIFSAPKLIKFRIQL